MKPIETIYKGYRFRSRLEARWAVFFDAAEIKYQYEPEGFECNPFGDKIYRYLPDFYLPDFDVYAEIKSNLEHLLQDGEKISCCIDFGMTPISKGIIILGQIPYCNNDIKYPIPSFNYLFWNKGVCCTTCSFISNFRRRLILFKDEEKASHCTSAPDLSLSVLTDDLYVYIDIHAVINDIPFKLTEYTQDVTSSRLNKCFLKARQARFEHGETPR